MYYRAEQLLNAYPNEFTGSTKGRGALLCTDSAGVYLLKEYRGSPMRLELLNEVLGALRAQDFLCEELVRTTEGGLCCTDIDGTRYFLRKTYQGRECDTRNAEEILQLTRHLAKLHLHLADVQAKLHREPPFRADLTGDAQKRTRELKKVKNYVRAKNKKNEFEREFLKGYAHYLAQAQAVEEAQKETVLPEHTQQLCHGDVNQHNFLFTKEGLAVIGFDKLRCELFVADLTNLMRKILEKHNWNSGLGMDMVMAYNDVRTLENWELRQLYLRLLYPEKYWKLVNHYFNARKTWVSQRDIDKLRRISEQEIKREEFLSLLFYLVK